MQVPGKDPGIEGIRGSFTSWVVSASRQLQGFTLGGADAKVCLRCCSSERA